MTYGYVRVSTDKQTVANQRFEIVNFCAANNVKIDRWIEETISGTKSPEKRLLGSILSKVKPGDLIICSELSRLGRGFFMIMSILHHLLNNNVRVWTIKDNYRLGDDIQSKVLAFAFGISAEIERSMVSQRTIDALKRKRSEGMILGRPNGSKSNKVKLSGHEREIKALIARKYSKSEISRIYGVNRITLNVFLKERLNKKTRSKR